MSGSDQTGKNLTEAGAYSSATPTVRSNTPNQGDGESNQQSKNKSSVAEYVEVESSANLGERSEGIQDAESQQDDKIIPADQNAADNSNRNISKDNAESDDIPKQKVLLQRTSSSNKKKLNIPKINCQEKIILCVDHSPPMFTNNFRRAAPTQSSKQASIFQVLISAIRQFVMTKSFIDKQHQFSLMLMNEDVQLITEMSSQPSNVLYMLQDIANNTTDESVRNAATDMSFDLSPLFKQIHHLVEMPEADQQAKTAPPYIVRVVFVYGRSDCSLEFFGGLENYRQLMDNPYFFFDSIYIHEEPSEENLVTQIFTSLCQMDEQGTSHIHEVGMEGGVSSLYNSFANLLAHPLQRQSQTNNSTHDIVENVEASAVV